ncbi:MAG: DNA replication/repair protein RecF [Alicyclobacillus herbarius]|uniref:DNA replication/repair protein RecF n=1 Tax=Alicyclobacillus herbarius TaxID=122960 RepID=UPI002354ECE5|nr:DNA replication/repair protein RecF [Alicyclobacillus herbarius]MCL6631789.1 DNA replication/repair protein RecF [Alicyclobacillus herbarius]
MQIEHLVLRDFRNYVLQEVEFAPGVNVLLGENGQGKTNVLEAIYLLAVGKSHRTSRDVDLIRYGADQTQLTAVITHQERPSRLRLEFGKFGKKAHINGVLQSKMSDFVGRFQVVLFAPEDLQLVKGGPAVRRRFIDIELGQTHARYLHHLSQYHRTLQQRNHLLKRPSLDLDSISAFDDPLVHHGTEVMVRRQRFISLLREIAREIYTSIAEGREELDLHYQMAVATQVDGRSAEENPSWSADQLQAVFQAQLEAKLGADRQLGYTSVGPHRDDLVLYLDGRPVQAHASQGQQRTIALSLRLAEIELIRREVGEYPVLLLDDVLSELDDHRQRQLLLSMSDKVQTLVTSTGLYQLGDRLEGRSRLFHVRSGIIQKEG